MISVFSLAEKDTVSTGEFFGLGQIEASADFISLTLQVRSLCQLTPLAAQRATDNIVEKIYTYLQKLKKGQKDDEHFKIIVDGGYTAPYSHWINNRKYCKNTFQKTTDMTLNIAARKNFDKLYADLQTYVHEQFEQDPPIGPDELPQVYVSIYRPDAKISKHHQRVLEKKAWGLALKDAKENFKAAITSCQPHRYKILSIRPRQQEEPSHSSLRPYFKRIALPMRNEETDTAIAPVRFDSIKVEKQLWVKFAFEGTLCFE
jgi:hypothetical protein